MPKANIKQAKSLTLGKKRLYFVTRDVERAAAGLILDIPNFYIITNDSPYSKEIKKRYGKNIKIITHPNQNVGKKIDIKISDIKILDTLELLKHPDTKKIIKPGDLVVVFKSTTQIEKYCAECGWNLLNPSAELANQVEEKISQIKWLGPLAKYLPKYKIIICKDIFWDDKKFILQFNRTHTGSGTILITSKKQLEEIKKKFPNREVRVAEYIPGPLFTNNNIVWGDKILLGNISYQITGLKPFTDLPFATIGNDWALPHKILNATQIKQYKKIATEVGERLAGQGWRGLFGIDVVINENTGQLYLLEVNARQPASTTYESELQHSVILSGAKNPLKQTSRDPSVATLPQDDNLQIVTFEAHLSALLQIPYQGQKTIPIKTGAQIIQRVLSDCHCEQNETFFKKSYKVIKYNNTKPGNDLFRYQFTEGIMKGHNQLNF